MSKLVPGLEDVSETMLWTLYSRASEARRPNAIIEDPDAVLILDAIAFDFKRHFGAPEQSHAVRSVAFDRIICQWLAEHPDGTIVSLGEGLETQARRVDNGRMRWLSVDLPDAIHFREKFIRPTDRHCHMAANALDPAWLQAIDADCSVLVVAQGLLMYFEAEDVRKLLTDMAGHFGDFHLVFDTVPKWFGRLTQRGLNLTRHYKVPAMPWGIDRDEVMTTLSRWGLRASQPEGAVYSGRRGLIRVIESVLQAIPPWGGRQFAVFDVRFRATPQPDHARSPVDPSANRQRQGKAQPPSFIDEPPR